METPLFILGFLLRYGSMHGYKIKKLLDEQVADFTSIKTSNLYYHLNKMMDKGYIRGEKRPQAEKPDKTIYEITEEGKQEFKSLLVSSLDESIKFNFSLDNTLFFNDYVDDEEYKEAICAKLLEMKQQLEKIKAHKQIALNHVDDEDKKYAELIFVHHEQHIKVEIDWLEELKSRL